MTSDITWRQIAASSPWGARAMPRGGVLDDHFFIIGGRSGATKVYSDTWRSPDGITWERMSKGTGWGRRCYPEVDIVDGHLILTGGQGLRKFYNDVWRSSNFGRTWEQVCADAPWAPRAGHHTITVGREILLFAGGRNSFDRVFYPELWVSRDLGETWTQRSELPQDMGRAGMQVVELNGAIYFMGGDHDKPVFRPNWEGRRNDIWKSDDAGVTWELLGNAPWQPRTGQQCVTHADRVICIGGHAQGDHATRQILLHDMWVWDPSKGVDAWELVSDNVWGCRDHPERDGKSDFLLTVHHGQLWTLGGDREVQSPWPQDNDVWAATLPPTW